MEKTIKHFILFIISFLLTASNTFSQEIDSSNGNNILALINNFSNEDPFAAGDAIIKIVNYGDKAVDYLVKSLSDKNDDTKWCSAIALFKIAPEGKKAIPSLKEALKDKNSNVRWCSALALGKFKKEAESAVPQLLNLLYDDDRDVRWAAYVSLNKIGKKSFNKIPKLFDVTEKLEMLTPQLMEELKVPGVSISIIKDYKLKWSKCFGVTDVVGRKKVNHETMFEACSMSKPVFTYLVLRLVEQGKLDLDKPLYNYLSEEFVSPEEDYSKMITARMVLTHTSGLPNWRKGGEEKGGPLPVYFKPGTKFSYSGEGMYYLQRVVEHITHEPLEVFAKQELFDKLRFKSTSFVWTKQFNPQIATGHNNLGKCNKRSKYTHADAAYTLYTTPDEYAKFMIEIMKPDTTGDFSLSNEMISEMLSHQIRVDIRDVIDRPGRALGIFSYRGLGWGIDSTITGNIVYHSGANRTGFRCYSQFNREEGSGIVIMTNSENGSKLWERLISAVGDL